MCTVAAVSPFEALLILFCRVSKGAPQIILHLSNVNKEHIEKEVTDMTEKYAQGGCVSSVQ
jgi:hypothetical protein